ncbi:hypothetical protein J31TS4_04780 [Paenibacillus sp. J31TS4]|uniref:TetR/AcrR family transcriptional regulator n=1 Tax=Paenibacillus sp. J31TS4 TaxID=2807195 RepID=UPI001B294799|nr:TetR/AcrR family transcriptional regulator [Paenibacillus sp. J31TS4]GIP37198.1 hypothetical protein J31TS4_04780 [Paenibacillus sp. J31TS4]
MGDLPLRERKKAKAKLAVYQAGIALIGQNGFRSVSVEEICRQAEVSKVTFFNFFPRKEDLLVYFMRVWLTERVLELEEEPLRGVAAFRHLLVKVHECSQTEPGLMPSLISLLAELRMHPCVPDLSEAEIALLFPGRERIAQANPDMFQLFDEWAREAAEDGELREGLEPELVVPSWFSVFYGAFLTAYLYRADSVLDVYDAHLRLFVREKEQ